jgi:hypothetical protein
MPLFKGKKASMTIEINIQAVISAGKPSQLKRLVKI